MVERSRNRLLALAVLAFQVGCNACGVNLKSGDPQRPDIVLISVDTLRADHLHSYGYFRETSPFFDSLAADGVRFDFAHSASPWTLPAHTTMLTGQLPMTHRIVEDTLKLPTEAVTLPELLQGEGYATGGFVATYYVSSLFNFDQGFDEFDDFGLTEQTNLKGEVVAEDVVDNALKFYEKQEDGQAVFLFIHLYDVHYSYDPPSPYSTKFDRAPTHDDLKYKNYFYYKKNLPSEEQFEHQVAQYDESILYVNDQLRRIKEATDEAGRDVRFVITADHGEEFGERGSWGHAHTLYAEQLHVPLIFSGGGLPSGVVSDAAVGTHDIAPTIAAWAGVGDLLPNPDGTDLAPIMEGKPLPDRVLTAETTRFETNRLSIYADGLRLEWDLKNRKKELFDPHGDPNEQTDVLKTRQADRLTIEKKLLEALGTPWQVNQPGKLVAKHIGKKKGKKTALSGAILMETEDKGLQVKGSTPVEPGQKFAILPYDAEVIFQDENGKELGVWQAIGDNCPDGTGPLTLTSCGTAGASDISAEQKAQLEALGYIE